MSSRSSARAPLRSAPAPRAVGAGNKLPRLERPEAGRPALEAELLFERDDWEAAFILDKRRPPRTPPLNDVLRLVATLGGFLGRKGDGKPGVKTIGLGLFRASWTSRPGSSTRAAIMMNELRVMEWARRWRGALGRCVDAVRNGFRFGRKCHSHDEKP